MNSLDVNIIVNLLSMYYSWTPFPFRKKATDNQQFIKWLDCIVSLGSSFLWGILPHIMDICKIKSLSLFLSLSLSPSEHFSVSLSLLCLPVPFCFLPLTPFPLCPTFTGQMPKAVLLCPQLPSLTVLCKRLLMSVYVCVCALVCLCMCACVFAWLQSWYAFSEFTTIQAHPCWDQACFSSLDVSSVFTLTSCSVANPCFKTINN